MVYLIVLLGGLCEIMNKIRLKDYLAQAKSVLALYPISEPIASYTYPVMGSHCFICDAEGKRYIFNFCC
jgi:hypothetical protein